MNMNATAATIAKTTVTSCGTFINENVHDFVVDMSHDALYESIKLLAVALFVSDNFAPLFVLAGFALLIGIVHLGRRIERRLDKTSHRVATAIADSDADYQAFLRILHEHQTSQTTEKGGK